MATHLDRNALEELRARKRKRHFYRLASPTTVEYEHQRKYMPSHYAFTKFECIPADDLSFDVCALWPSTVPVDYQIAFELAVAEGVADVLLDGLYQHSGCAVTLVEVRYDEINSCEAGFMKSASCAMQNLLATKWI